MPLQEGKQRQVRLQSPDMRFSCKQRTRVTELSSPAPRVVLPALPLTSYIGPVPSLSGDTPLLWLAPGPNPSSLSMSVLETFLSHCGAGVSLFRTSFLPLER